MKIFGKTGERRGRQNVDLEAKVKECNVTSLDNAAEAGIYMQQLQAVVMVTQAIF